jgi:hypothetical protein
MITRKFDTGVFSVAVAAAIALALYLPTLSVEKLSSFFMGLPSYSVVFYSVVATISSRQLLAELNSNRIKLWLALPETRTEYFKRVFLGIWLRSLLVIVVLMLALVFVHQLKFYNCTVNYILIAAGTLQLSLLLTVLSMLITLFVPGELTLPIMVIVPWFILYISQMFMSSKQALGVLVMRSVLPVYIGVYNIMHGFSDFYTDGFYMTAEANIYSVVWLLIAGVVISKKFKFMEF